MYNQYNPYYGANYMNSINNGLRGSMANSYLMNSGRQIGSGGLLKRISTSVNWNSLLNNTSRTLNVINQAIPVVKQVKPLVTNAKTMLKIANIMKYDDKPTKTKKEISKSKKDENINSSSSSNQPTFFV